MSEAAVELAAMIEKAVESRVGPNATFEERQDAAAAVVAEVRAEFKNSRAQGSKAGS